MMKRIEIQHILRRMSTLFQVGMCASLISISMGCDTEEDGDDISIEEELCMHMAEDAVETISATEMAEDAPLLEESHARTEVDELSETHTYIRFEAGESGDYLFAFSEEVTVQFEDDSGNLIQVESLDTQDGCDDIYAIVTIELEVGTYYISISGDTEIIGVGFENASAEHDHEHEEDEHDE